MSNSETVTVLVRVLVHDFVQRAHFKVIMSIWNMINYVSVVFQRIKNWISICHCQNMSLVSSVIFIIIVIIILSLLLISYYNYCCYYYYCCCCCYYYYYYYDDNVQWCPVRADGWYGFRSSLGPLLANVFMSHIEEDLEREGKPPSFYQRCVDNTLTIMPKMGT